MHFALPLNIKVVTDHSCGTLSAAMSISRSQTHSSEKSHKSPLKKRGVWPAKITALLRVQPLIFTLHYSCVLY